ncbi:hypothetical protein L915_17322 [Plasmopara halstedii]|uniref:SAM domain-containing protein n=1 Tax=Plasmopara halstedii TaxID=4781 RepID=A0A0P1ARW8_PLAHL|nr:hypothetical protein L915_17322 [Plasmopara halstedii]CEG44333.1 hypothetical protein L915_17322 [Plasmopara halstedii]|eukprot:XP_024580702.1 hypothetical protein L915_17322 [Plasmopara halstedii]
MDWEANLAAIIKCTDANLAQRFREFEDSTDEYARVDEAPAIQFSGSNNVGANHMRETIANEYRQRRQQDRQQSCQQIPSTSRAFAAFKGAKTPVTTFSQHFHQRQDQKRNSATVGRAKDNQQTNPRGSEDGHVTDEDYVQDYHVNSHDATMRDAFRGPFQQQMFLSPSYNIAQVMEQVRLSLKLEIDARAVIAERQLSQLSQLCKATSEELDQLRVEVCANDRQLHTLDQVQSKIRQELTTQKDIGFHLQSMCGKDESWRMQAENQLLELRQTVAALREQGNSTQAVAQEKLSRSELLVQFNSAFEPLKAHLQANLQHQAQQIADITHTTSSSSLLLDRVTQKINRRITDELNELRSDISALKHHVAKVEIHQDCGRQLSKTKSKPKEKDGQQEQDRIIKELREELQTELFALVKDYVDAQTKPLRYLVDASSLQFVEKTEMVTMRDTLDETCRTRCAATTTQLESIIVAAQDRLQGECIAKVKDSSDRLEKSLQQTANSMSSAFDGRVKSWQNKWLDFVKSLNEQKERIDELHESLRKSRHRMMDQLNALEHQNQKKCQQLDSDIETRLKDSKNHAKSLVADSLITIQASLTSLKSFIHAEEYNIMVELEQKLKRSEGKLSRIDLAIAALSNRTTSLGSSSSASTIDTSIRDVTLALQKQTSVHIAAMDNLFQKMQQQFQQQCQSHVQMTTMPSQYQGFWPIYPYTATPALTAPAPHIPTTTDQPGTLDVVTRQPTAPTPTAPKTESATCLTPGSDSLNGDNSIKVDIDGKTVNAPAIDANCVHNKQLLKLTELSGSVSDLPTDLKSMVGMTRQTIALSDQIKEQDFEQASREEAKSKKRECTLAATAKGAQAEAELAKARVEGRRKQVQDVKQRQSPLSSHTQPTLSRSVSSSAVGATVASKTELRIRGPVSVPSTPMAGDYTQLPVSPPSLTQKKADKIEATLSLSKLSVSSIGSYSEPPRTISRTNSALSHAHKYNVESANSPALDDMPKKLPLSSSQSNDVPQNITQDVRLSIPASISSNEVTLALAQSPIAKIFGRSSILEARRIRDDDISSDQVVSDAVTKQAPSDEDNVSVNASVGANQLSAPMEYPYDTHFSCELCRLPVRSDLKFVHEESQCPNRVVHCKFCMQQVQFVNVTRHERECNTTNRVTLSETEAESNPDRDIEFEKSSKQCRHCAARIPGLLLLEHETNCDKVMKQCPHCLRRQKMSELANHVENCDCRLVSCPNGCGGKFLQRGVPTHLATRCPKTPSTIAATAASSASRPACPEAIKTTASLMTPSEIDLTEKVKCKFCDDEIEASKIEDHEQNCDWKPKRCFYCNMVVISRDLLRHETSCKSNVKSCAYCNKKMPQSALINHASRCSKRPIKCIRCCKLIPSDTIVAHSTNCKVELDATLAASNLLSGQLSNTTSNASTRIPPPPPFPPPPDVSRTLSTPTPQDASESRLSLNASIDVGKATDENHFDRMARRQFAFSKLTNSGSIPTGMQVKSIYNQASASSAMPAGLDRTKPVIRSNHQYDKIEDDKEDYDADKGHLTLAQVVKDWTVENVCLWLHEDVGVSDAVRTFQNKQCDGEKLLRLTENDLVNDFKINDRLLLDRILSAIEVINTSNAFLDEDEEEDEEEDENEEDEDEDEDGSEVYHGDVTTHMQVSTRKAFSHPRDILQRPFSDNNLPSSKDMFRRISNALGSSSQSNAR